MSLVPLKMPGMLDPDLRLGDLCITQGFSPRYTARHFSQLKGLVYSSSSRTQDWAIKRLAFIVGLDMTGLGMAYVLIDGEVCVMYVEDLRIIGRVRDA